ncbi:MAG TPA: phosphomannose isomerase type II C-terminal cupin domain [Patescibacteria group bacterium]|nr:phosphomannose isomerase type II C-terminal cupin domain [Patescibacteria group bacterium]
MSKDPKKLPPGQAYIVGETDTRPWGSYTVVAAGRNEGEEYCEKEIIVNPGHILSLQSHVHRREHWMVKQGVLTVVLDGQRITLKKGGEIRIPVGGVHCMANLGTDACIVREVQAGICREEDIARYMDAYGRVTDVTDAANVQQSLVIYKQLLGELGKDV